MSRPTTRVVAMTGTVLIALALSPGAAAQGRRLLQLKTGMTLTYKGAQAQQADCTQWASFDQYARLSGLVILPETGANVYHLVEAWGRDSETLIVRGEPNGNVFVYRLGTEMPFFIRGPVGTFTELTDPDTGNTLRSEIVGDGITLSFPGGIVYDNLIRVDISCPDGCGSTPVLLESHFLGPDLAFPVASFAPPEEVGCRPRWTWLVSVTTK